MAGAEGRYDAFISYSHATDGALAPALQRGLTRLAKPWYRRQAISVFRDDTGLSVTPELWGSIETALDESSHLVLLASPDAAASEWVNREVEHWLATKGPATLLPVVTQGTLVWDDERGAIDAEHSTAVPPALVNAFTEEPRYLDFTWAHDVANLNLRDARFRSAVAELAAPIRGVPKEELESEDLSQHRRALRLARAAVATLAVLTIAAVVAAVLAISNAHVSESRRVDSLSRELAARSLVLAQSRPDAALNVVVAANEVRGTTEARSALLDVLSDNSRLDRVVDVGAHVPGLTSVQGLAFGPDGTIVANASINGSVNGMLVATGRGGRVRVLGRSADEYATFQAVAGGRLIVSETSSVDAIEHGTLRRLTPGRSVAVAPSGTRAVVDLNGEARIVDLETGTVLWRVPARVVTAELSRDATRAAIATSDDLVHVVDLTSGREVGPPISIGTISGLAWTARGELVVVSPADNRIVVFEGDSTGSPRDLPPGNVAEGGAVGVSPDGSLLAFRGQNTTAVWDLGAGTILWTRPDLPGARTLIADSSSAAVFSADGSHLLDVGIHGATLADAASGTVISRDPDAAFAYPDPSSRHAVTTGARTVLWDLVGGVRLSQFQGFASAAWSDDGSQLVTWGATTQLWDVRTDIVDSETIFGAGGVSKAVFSSGGSRVAAVTSDGHLLVWRAAGDIAASVVARRGAATTVSVASGSGELFEVTNGTLTIRTPSGRPERRFRVGPVTDEAPLPDGRRVVIQSDAGLTLWDARHGAVVRTGRICGTDIASALVFSGDGSRTAVMKNDRTVRICDSRGRVLHELRRPSASKDVNAALALSSDGSRIAFVVKKSARSGLVVRVADTEDGTTTTTIRVGTAPREMVFSGARLMIAAGRQVTVVDVGGDRFSLQTAQSVGAAFADHGKIVVIGETRGDAVTDGSQLELYDVDVHRAIGVLDERTVFIDSMVAPGGGPEVLALGQPARTITDVSTVVVRQAVTPATLLAEACRLSGGPLSRGDWARLVPGTDYMSTCATK